jgi:tRNA threonylcarbamoyladenosine biosynthesis protein TsaB
MALILNIETATPICSVCLAKDGELLDLREDRQGTSHARLLTVFIDDLLKCNKLKTNQLDAIAISSGPGSYTGLRIGTSVAKGLCYALNKPLIAVPTLLALAKGIHDKVTKHNSEAPFGGLGAGAYMPVLDARRMDIYTSLYDTNYKELLPVACPTVDQSLQEKILLFGEIYIGGNAVNKCREIFTSPHIHFVGEINSDSRNMIPFSASKLQHAQFEDMAYFEPFYLKDFGQKG